MSGILAINCWGLMLLEMPIFISVSLWKKKNSAGVKFVDCASSRVLKHRQSSEQMGHNSNQVMRWKCFKGALKRKFKWHSSSACYGGAAAAARPPGSHLWFLSGSAIRQIWFVALTWWCQTESKGGSRANKAKGKVHSETKLIIFLSTYSYPFI